MPLHPIRPTFILSDGAQPTKVPDIAGISPRAAVVNAVFLINSLLVAINKSIISSII
jgi:hypothetical protein